MGLARIEHLDDFARRRLVDVDFETGGRTATPPKRVGNDRLEDRIEAGDANDGALAGAELAQSGFGFVDLPDHALGVRRAAAGRHRSAPCGCAVDRTGGRRILEQASC